MGLHVLVGLVGLAAQPLSLGQRGRVRLLAALAAVLVVIQLLVRCRLLLPASRRTTHYHWAMLCLGPNLQRLCQSSSLLDFLCNSGNSPPSDGLSMHRLYSCQGR